MRVHVPTSWPQGLLQAGRGLYSVTTIPIINYLHAVSDDVINNFLSYISLNPYNLVWLSG